MIKKIFIALFLAIALIKPASAWFWDKKGDVFLYLTPFNPQITINNGEKLTTYDIFKVNSRIYFLVYSEDGFKSDYIKYQIIKQDDKVENGGYSRIRNITKRVSNKNFYIDYFVLPEAGKYALQIFDIENVHHWLVFAHFLVVND